MKSILIRGHGRKRAVVAFMSWLVILIAAGGQAWADPASEDATCREHWRAVSMKPLSTAYLHGKRVPGVVAGQTPLTLASSNDAVVVETWVQPGELVQMGQRLLRLSSEDLERDDVLSARDVELAHQDVIKLRERARSIASNLQRHRTYPDLFAKSEIDSLEADRISADAEVHQARLRLQQAMVRQKSLVQARQSLMITAPRSGYLRRLQVQTGMRIPAGTALAEISGEGEKRLRFALPAAVAATLKDGDAVCVVVPDRKWVAAVRLDGMRRQSLDAGETVAIETAVGAAHVWPAGLSVDVLPVAHVP